MLVTRKMIMEALLDLLKGSETRKGMVGIKTFSRRFKVYNQVSSSAGMPMLILTTGQELYGPRATIRLPAKREIYAEITIYLNEGQDQGDTTIPDNAVCDLLDNLDEILKPIPPYETQTLGGLVNHCYIEGDILKVPGDIDGVGMIVVPIKILIP